ncbi:MAG: Dyp-type peroxidase [Bradyrhizobium sp.]|uniref:Dyp-type peroxidase n=1 Tax=Bradyrhizobium sp. TaxID=376 RepID=UPI001C28FDF7|nr:Dyp-type peroxidase [Bradyrhizobium sp.]MBU6463144.1 Dyp-type peroxidase [Pseudomonadota bacterium]MDE2068721.1 Dyp-type peroxidase [Bradyrhizobium sp.]MDE2243292.1 Dyp-type peroxidase [Bradyrhizobium sp.]MDE2469537.1 Dyp-type peroxidase [Bradyrhizobium sp.]
MADSSDRVPIEPQSIITPLSRAAVFLVLSIGSTPEAIHRVRGVIADIGGLVRTVGFRDLQGRLSCNVAIGSAAWDRLGQSRRPAQLRPFAEIRGPVHTAVATPGDLLFHIRADRADMCFELERLILETLGDAVTVADEVEGFRYFDSRDLLGFVDGTENPTGTSLVQSTLIQSEDPPFEGGSYVVVQKYLHKLDKWQGLDTATQESIIGRTKADNVELEDVAGRESHKQLTTIVDAEGVEHDILRDNMPFGSPGRGEFGTYFIGYTRNLWVIEKMLENMFKGISASRHDRILDFSTPMTGTTFFAPSYSMLRDLG